MSIFLPFSFSSLLSRIVGKRKEGNLSAFRRSIRSKNENSTRSCNLKHVSASNDRATGCCDYWPRQIFRPVAACPHTYRTSFIDAKQILSPHTCNVYTQTERCILDPAPIKQRNNYICAWNVDFYRFRSREQEKNNFIFFKKGDIYKIITLTLLK